jgi:hypothetical protein
MGGRSYLGADGGLGGGVTPPILDVLNHHSCSWVLWAALGLRLFFGGFAVLITRLELTKKCWLTLLLHSNNKIIWPTANRPRPFSLMHQGPAM